MVLKNIKRRRKTKPRRVKNLNRSSCNNKYRRFYIPSKIPDVLEPVSDRQNLLLIMF